MKNEYLKAKEDIYVRNNLKISKCSITYSLDVILKEYNKIVSKGDTLIHVGDGFCFTSSGNKIKLTKYDISDRCEKTISITNKQERNDV